ncbi:MAG: phosphoribosyltransferase family protein [Archangium sp.]|nr:phosphoribosyltransferase family protein [Archangium sp.]MDP3151075.1 phosphoribosyltransferase family protein [Archangium sp.]MDP3571759.1 phosphoribosyltransferase family protein [Archangium sp.]
MATKKKKTAAPAKPSRPTRAKPEAPVDVFSAAGGMPSFPQGFVGREGSSARQTVRELTWGDFDRQVQALAREVRSFKAEAVVGLAHGGVFVGGALASALKAEFYPVRVTHRSRDTGRSSRVTDDMPKEISGRRVLIVDDVASSGDSIEFATRLARSQGAKAIKSAALIARPGKFEPDFVGVTSADFFVFPWDYQDVVEDQRFEPEDGKPARAARRS